MLIEYLRDLEFVDACVVFVAYAIAVVIALVSHEYMHSYVAVKQGDLTPKAYGRLTFNPIAHFDIVGLLCFIFVGFGWAKPVPINPLNFYKHKKGVILVSLAGIVTNLAISFVCMGLFVLSSLYLTGMGIFSTFLVFLFLFCYSINIYLAIFNLLPIYPLDGFNFLNAFLRYENRFVGFMMRYGWIILLLLIFSGAIGWIMTNVGGFLMDLGLKFWTFIFA